MHKRRILSNAIKLALAGTMSIALTGCLVEGDTSTSVTSADLGSNYVQVANPVGTVMGLVQDIQGNPIKGAIVSIGGRSVTTGTGGSYQFNDIPVTDVVVNTSDSNDGSETIAVLDDVNGSALTQALLLSIVPPSGYLGAVVTVTAPASVIEYGGDGSCSDGSTTITCETSRNTHTFIDGFVAQAGTAVLPALNATVQGILRDSSTGVAMPNTAISLEMTGTYGGTLGDTSVLNDPAFNGVNVSYAVKNITGTTDANGYFAITDVPSKSSLEPKVAGYHANSVQFNTGLTTNSISTQDWTSAVDVGAVMMSPNVAALDTVFPYVTRVETVTNGTPGLFNDDVDLTSTGTGIIVHFNEPVANSVDAATIENSVELMVWSDTGMSASDGVLDIDEAASAGYVTPSSITLSADRTSMTVVLPTNLTEGQSIHVNMLTVDFTDVAGNPLTTNPAATMSYDSALTGASTGNGNFIRLAISTFVEINKSAPAVTATQLATDDTGVDIDPDQLAINAVFADVNDADTLVSHLNATDDDGIGAADASARLTALHTAMGGTAVVDGDQTLVSFAQTTASAYIVTVANENGVNQIISGALSVTDNEGNLGGGGVALGALLVPTDSNPVRLVLNGVEAGWAVTVVPTDDLFYPGTPNTLTLVDNVPPTTVLQTSYGVAMNSNYLVTGDTFGDGGELSNLGAVTGGTPYLNVTAQMLDNLDAFGDPSVLAASGSAAGQDDDSLAMELTANNVVDGSTGGTGVAYINTGYDSVAYTAMAAAANRTIGVAFSEDITKVTDPGYSGTATLTNWVVQNDTTQQDDGAANNVDLMTTDINSVFILAKDDGAVVDFTDDVTDSASNASVAAVNPKVVIRDALPPFITSGTYNGDTMTLVFNETVVPKNGDTFVFDDGTTATLSVFPANGNSAAVNYSIVTAAGISTLTINDSAWGNNLTLLGGAGAFPLPAYAAPATVTREHGLLTFATIEDANGNNWTNGLYGLGAAVPFALETTVDPTMTVTTASAGAVNAATSFTVTYTTTHRIDMTAFGVAANVTTLTAAQVAANFTLTGTGVIDAVNTTAASLSSNGRTLTVTVALTTALASTDTFDLTSNAGNLDSDWDATQSDSATQVLVP